MWNREAPSREEGSQQPYPTVPGRPVEERRVAAWVGKSILFKGDLTGLEDMTIDGRVEGTIELRDHSLTIGPDAHIRADIIAKVVTIFGTVTGTITASETVNVRETGSVEGDISSRWLAMADGAIVRGRIQTGAKAGSQPDRQPELTAV